MNQLVYSVKITVKVDVAIIKAVKATIEAVDANKIKNQMVATAEMTNLVLASLIRRIRTSTQVDLVRRVRSPVASHRTAKLAVKDKIISKTAIVRVKNQIRNDALSFVKVNANKRFEQLEGD